MRSTLAAAALFTSAGVAHFARPDFFESIVPDWFPNARFAKRVSGAAEIALGLGLLSPRTRRPAALGLIALLAIVFPANIDMAVNRVEVKPVDPLLSKSGSDPDGFIHKMSSAPSAVALHSPTTGL